VAEVEEKDGGEVTLPLAANADVIMPTSLELGRENITINQLLQWRVERGWW
jgi:flagellar motor switch/type III secretory pathway protein FliN